ncbi:hypothetical protein AQUCO_01000714v1 [Aquilegia coerulea]|uniref:Uncharacterized protein n=1 Tax=Aquilegia coerulea TaxID=218851 RepID=A0A2G5EBE2_AQUCA|nr:hypothetical protein AQUCO_01000714v1 [Aquilegia coerulea]
MTLFFLTSILRQINNRYPILIYAVTWTVLLTVTVAVASFCPEIAFVSAISQFSSFSQGCEGDNLIRVPLDGPGEKICLPAQFFVASKLDYFVPPVFAAIVVAGSAFVVRTMGLWEDQTAE